ncbi:MAG TPA: sigma-70 family RNA polymerase sigma factor [Dongiaceae bacterium]|nr:sigma-70 family RNA polymerase sigma factor [Dongiaceae bacterium]
MMTSTLTAMPMDDAALVAASLAGNRDAFGEIVTRYQALICSLAYSTTGSVTHSEDIAQETFVAAWKQLATLREPARLRAWLCSIARNLTHNWLRRHRREPSHAAEPLDAVHDTPTSAPLPPEQTISNEEHALLWRALANIPETYREPLVLFYRENKSVAAVAEKLELSEENVRQRLLRGRKLLTVEMAAFVAATLERTAPGKMFTLGVLAALPVALTTSAKAATATAVVAKSGAAVTGASFLSVLAALAGPLLGGLGGYIGMRSSLKTTRTPRELAYMKRYLTGLFIGIVVFMIALLGLIFFALPFWKQSPVLVLGAGFVVTAGFAAFIFITAWRFSQKFARMRREEMQSHPEAFARDRAQLAAFAPWEYRSRTTLLGLPLVHIRTGRKPGEKLRPAVGWIAIGDMACGILFASGGLAVGGISFGGASVGLISLGGFSFGLLGVGGLVVSGVALGGGAIGLVASGGLALAWHAAIGGVAVARELAVGGVALAQHANDAVARDFFLRHHWLNIDDPRTRVVFYSIVFVPVLLQSLGWAWWQRRRRKT